MSQEDNKLGMVYRAVDSPPLQSPHPEGKPQAWNLERNRAITRTANNWKDSFIKGNRAFRTGGTHFA